MRLLLVVGTTRTAGIDGLSAAGSDRAMLHHTPAADAELVEYGTTVFAPEVPVSPSGCPTPAVVTRSVRELTGFRTLTVGAGLVTQTAAPTVTVTEQPGRDVRDRAAVPAAADIFETARSVGRGIPDAEVFVGESIPGGTTTALGVLKALGEPYSVSSSLPENPRSLKRKVVSAGLSESGLEEGDAAGEPLRALRAMGDPVLAAVAGLVVGGLESDTDVTLAGGTQMIAAGALVRHFGVEDALGVATTSFVEADPTANLQEATNALDLARTVTDPGFEQSEHVAFRGYCRGEAKEGVGMGGTLALAGRQGVPMKAVRDRIADTYEAVIETDGI